MLFTRSLLSAAALAVIAFSPVSAQAEVITDPTKAAAGVYTMDARHTNIIWTVSHLGFSNFIGRFDTAEGTLNYDPADPTKSTLKVTVDPNSISTNVPDFAKDLAGPEWINAQKGPITFVSTGATKTTATTGKLTGDLTLNGVTKPVTFDVTYVGAGDNPFSKAPVIGFSGKTTIKRSDFGIVKYVPNIGDEVAIQVESEFGLPAVEPKE
jgi:polyisoprenoid-binding protein YceI